MSPVDAGTATQAAASLLAKARQAMDAGEPYLHPALVGEAQAWATLALAIEAGAPPPNYPDQLPADLTAGS